MEFSRVSRATVDYYRRDGPQQQWLKCRSDAPGGLTLTRVNPRRRRRRRLFDDDVCRCCDCRYFGSRAYYVYRPHGSNRTRVVLLPPRDRGNATRRHSRKRTRERKKKKMKRINKQIKATAGRTARGRTITCRPRKTFQPPPGGWRSRARKAPLSRGRVYSYRVSSLGLSPPQRPAVVFGRFGHRDPRERENIITVVRS